MTIGPITASGSRLVEEARKLPAFFRRDLLTMWSYRTAFFTDWLNLLVQAVLFSFIGGLVDPRHLPEAESGGSYVAFVTVGIAVASFVQLAAHRPASAVRQEQVMGTLESVLLTPTTPLTFLLGSVVYELAYIPIRTFVFLLLVAIAFQVAWVPAGIVPAALVLVAFIPFVWGLGMVGAALVTTLRRGGALVGFGALLLTVASTSYVPIQVLPEWIRVLVAFNPLTITLDATRLLLLGGEGWSVAWGALAVLVPIGAVSVAVGGSAFHLALRYERKRGTLGLY